MRANVYIDGFNLYYGALRGTPNRWLDLRELCRHSIRPGDDLHRIRYFTADIRGDQAKVIRQQLYQRALRTIDSLTIYKGRFSRHPRWMPLANPPTEGPQHAYVSRTEEKGSDVNLAVHLVLDGARRDFQCAYVLSGDTDLVEAIWVVTQEFRRPVHVINPHGGKGRRLQQVATSYAPLDHELLPECQFPQELADHRGTFHRPPDWG